MDGWTVVHWCDLYTVCVAGRYVSGYMGEFSRAYIIHKYVLTGYTYIALAGPPFSTFLGHRLSPMYIVSAFHSGRTKKAIAKKRGEKIW